jgi:hypothetical protein
MKNAIRYMYCDLGKFLWQILKLVSYFYRPWLQSVINIMINIECDTKIPMKL